jgi:hypothetical protein
MINGTGAGADVGFVRVLTTSNRGWTPEELTDRAMEKIISISESTAPELRVQAEAFRDSVRQVVLLAMEQAVKSDRTTLINLLKKSGHDDLAEIVRKI